ncbi:hypothetical protein CTA1_3002 [Colletotrichum tanaceti]|uniref:Uncharacterized protein n=1 Tax=Colletotrichum tanaceti TaxID=1306861 RepID=A0A4U6XKR2_9PEZI|nr:hypothetical protein CTA1_3002 [Colletotrichum tanaceti]
MPVVGGPLASNDVDVDVSLLRNPPLLHLVGALLSLLSPEDIRRPLGQRPCPGGWMN